MADRRFIGSLLDVNEAIARSHAELDAALLPKPRKGKVAYPRETLARFEELKQRPDLLGIVADWLEERDSHPANAMLLPGVRLAFNQGRWPEKFTAKGQEPKYSWTFTRKAYMRALVPTYLVRLPLIPPGLLLVSMGCSHRRLMSDWGKDCTKPAKLIDCFLYLSMALDSRGFHQ